MGLFSFTKKNKNLSDRIDISHLPVHIGIIMDGNGRWAQRRGMPRNVGHKVGADTFKKIAIYCRDIGVQYLTVYAFSTENWKRPQEEVDAICSLLEEYIVEARDDLSKEKIKVDTIGDISAFSKELQEKLIDIRQREVKDAKLTVNIAINYGGRSEIVWAVNGIMQEIRDKKRELCDISEEELAQHLYTKELPEPDLIIRPSGELRLSNFMIWQSAYSEFWFSDVLWPDFTSDHLNQAIISYQKRDRRYGGV